MKRTGRAAGTEGKGFAVEEMADAKTAAALTGSGPLAAVDTILALQGIEDSPDSRTRGVNHGEHGGTFVDDRRHDGIHFDRAPGQQRYRHECVRNAQQQDADRHGQEMSGMPIERVEARIRHAARRLAREAAPGRLVVSVNPSTPQ